MDYFCIILAAPSAKLPRSVYTKCYVLVWVLLISSQNWGHAVVQCLRHCATNRKVAGSSPDGAIGIFR
jgi:hypothetical protein